MNTEFDWKTFEKIVVKTDHPIAVDSPDHLMPWGTSRDNSFNLAFNRRLMKLFRHKVGLKVLDLGCSGGGFVKSCVDDGCFAIGLEGSNYSQKLHRANWPLLGGKLLFTTDITKPFTVQSIHGNEIHPLAFHLITLWEVLEHLSEEALLQTFENIKKHLLQDGLLMISVSLREEKINGVALHQTVRSQEWWLNRFLKEGFIRMPVIEEIFGGHFIRGPHNAEGSINFVFSLSPEKISIPDELIPRKKKNKAHRFFNLITKKFF